MQSQLEQLEKDFGIEWQEYELSQFFGIQNTLSFNKDKLTAGSAYDYVTRTSKNQGILQETGFVNQANINPAGIWSLGLLQMDFFYRRKPWYAGQFIRKIIPKIELSKNSVLYFTALLNKQKQDLLSGLVRDVDEAFLNAKVSLPIKNSLIAFDFIEQFIATLQAERLATLQAYLITTGLKNYTLSDEEQAALDGLDTTVWSEFKIGDVFEKLNLKNHNKTFDKLLDTSKTQTDEFNLPLVNAKLGNNGIMFYGREADFDSAEMTLDVISNGAVATGTVYTQPHKVGVLWDAYLLRVKTQKMNRHELLYLTTSLEKSIKTKFGWEDKAVWSKVQHEIISLPIKPDQTPDYDHMRLVISAMQKVVIKNLVDDLDVRMAKTDKIVPDTGMPNTCHN